MTISALLVVPVDPVDIAIASVDTEPGPEKSESTHDQERQVYVVIRVISDGRASGVAFFGCHDLEHT